MRNIIAIVLVLLIATAFLMHLDSPEQFAHYAVTDVPFELTYPAHLTANTDFLPFGPSLAPQHIVTAFGTEERVHLLVSITPASRTIEDVLKNGYGTFDQPIGITAVDRHEAVVLKQPGTKETERYELFLIAHGLEYYFVFDSPHASEMQKSIKIK